MTKITINGRHHNIDGDTITHERICELAERPLSASAVYRGKDSGDYRRTGITHVGVTVDLEEDMVFTAIMTGDA